MKKLFFFLLIVMLAASNAAPQTSTGSIDPANTFVFVAGVLKWQSPSLSSFSDRNRKDEELYNALLASGVREANTVYLKDDEATLDMMTAKLKELLLK